MRWRTRRWGWKTFIVIAGGGCTATDPGWTWSPERVWSIDDTDDQHHVAVAALPDGGAAVAWTDGPLEDPNHTAWVRWVDPTGVPGDARELQDDEAGKPDLELGTGGAVVVAYQGSLGIDVEILTTTGSEWGEPIPAAPGGNTPDVGLGPDGRVVVVWYEQQDGVGTYVGATLGPDLVPTAGLNGPFAVTDDKSSAAPDVEVDPDGIVGVVWGDQSVAEEDPDALYLDRYGADGALGWRLQLDAEQADLAPRRGTVVARTDGSWLVGWRARALDHTPFAVRLGWVDATGAFVAGPTEPAARDADEIVIASIDDDRLWVVWTDVGDPLVGRGVIRGGIWSVPAWQWLTPPVAISPTGDGSRPHTDATLHADGRVSVVVGYEHHGENGLTVVRGRIGQLPSPTSPSRSRR